MAARVPVPDIAKDCLAMELQREPEALSALERMGPEDAVPGAVLDLGSRCMVRVQAAPAFADGIERSEGTQLEASVKACLRAGFERLDQRVVDAALGQAVGPHRDTDVSTTTCGQGVGGGVLLATDQGTGTTQARVVTATMSHYDDDLLDLTIKDAAGHEGSLRTTDHHKMWSVSAGGWVLAVDLQPGDQLREPDGTTASVVELKHRPGRQSMLDLTVEQTHTFYVDFGGQAILVHNEGGMEGCSDAAYQGVLHIREEIAAEGSGGSHSWAANMSDNDLADYLDDFSTSHVGQALEEGGVGWYDPERGVAIFQRSEHSMTAYLMSYEDFIAKLR